jgi:RNA polymerase sigma-70 factor (ECF subfamily)
MDIKLTVKRTNPGNVSDIIKEKFENEAFPHIEPIWQTALLLVENEDGANKVVQDTFIRAFQYWNQTDHQINCQILLFKTLAELQFSENKWQCLQSELSSNHAHADDQSPQPMRLSCQILGEALAELRPEMRFVTILSLRLRFAHREIAEIIGSDLGTIQAIICTGRQQLHSEVLKILNRSAKHDSEIIKIAN